VHEGIGHTDRIVGILKEHRPIRRPVERGIVSRVNECPGFLLFHDFTVDELFDVRMINIQHDHFGGAAGLTAGLDGPG
jgi:hypothetical protein